VFPAPRPGILEPHAGNAALMSAYALVRVTLRIGRGLLRNLSIDAVRKLTRSYNAVGKIKKNRGAIAIIGCGRHHV